MSDPQVHSTLFRIMLLHDESLASNIALTKTEYNVLENTIRIAVYYTYVKKLSSEVIELLGLLI